MAEVIQVESFLKVGYGCSLYFIITCIASYWSHSGRIDISSSSGQGACFLFRRGFARFTRQARPATATVRRDLGMAGWRGMLIADSDSAVIVIRRRLIARARAVFLSPRRPSHEPPTSNLQPSILRFSSVVNGASPTISRAVEIAIALNFSLTLSYLADDSRLPCHWPTAIPCSIVHLGHPTCS
ncbi:uncharacterized protein BDV17DRAFT_67482 [Aspergillus undulatus]|uniref:uncharacterized protein n=1 Tax=Aspergillus undulatus TaxID=1810928 RepID=UPI003CCDFA08